MPGLIVMRQDPETTEADVGNLDRHLQSLPEYACSRRSNAIGLPAVLRRQWLDQALLQSGEDSVEGAGSIGDTAHLLDVLIDCVSLFGTTCEARDDQDRRVLGTA